MVFLCGLIALLALGCDGSTANQQQVAVAQQIPEEEFAWGIERLKRALQDYGASSSDGLSISGRNVDAELFPPDDENRNYTARVTITTETSFLHGRRRYEKGEEAAKKPDTRAEIDDPLAEKSEAWENVIDLPELGPHSPSAASTKIETRSVDSKTIFDMTYVDGHWKLTRQPKLRHEQLWFEYAFE